MKSTRVWISVALGLKRFFFHQEHPRAARKVKCQILILSRELLSILSWRGVGGTFCLASFLHFFFFFFTLYLNVRWGIGLLCWFVSIKTVVVHERCDPQCTWWGGEAGLERGSGGRAGGVGEGCGGRNIFHQRALDVTFLHGTRELRKKRGSAQALFLPRLHANACGMDGRHPLVWNHLLDHRGFLSLFKSFTNQLAAHVTVV